MLGTITDGKGVTASLPMIGGSLSDALGAATVKIPAGTKKAGLTTTAPGFAKDRHDFNTQGSPEIKLKRGRVVTVRAVDADALVMAAHPTSLASDPQRFALVNLKDGEIARQTITMERDVPRAVRELTIVYLDGKPLADTQLTVTEVTTSDDDLSGDWQQWSVQRLGPVSEGKSDTNGRVLLSYPSVVDGQRVRSLRLHVQGHPEKDVAFRSYVTVPVKRDRRVIIVVPAKTSPAPGALRGATATYATWAATEDLSRQELSDPVADSLPKRHSFLTVMANWFE